MCLGGVSGCERKAETASGPAEGNRPNVLLISIDTLRPDHLRCYGYKRDTSPRLDQLAAEGVLFENHISSSSWTLPAHAALFTSLDDSVHGCTDTDRKLPAGIVTLAERFAAAGYKTAGFFSGPYLHPAFGLGQGFEHYENCTSYAKVIDERPVGEWAMNDRVMRRSHGDITSPRVYVAVRSWLDRNRESRFFMFIHLWDPHYDFIPPSPYNTRFDRDYRGRVTGRDFFVDPRINATMPRRDLEHVIALYDGEIAWTDAYVGNIIDDLKAGGLLDEMVVAVTSDHGEEFFEHLDKGHRKTLFDEVIRIPLIIRYPAALPAGARVRAQTRLIDVGPTLLELAGLPLADGEVMGHSLVPLMREGTLHFDNTAVSELFSVGREMRSMRTLEWKLTDVMNRNARFYVHLASDRREQRPISDFTVGVARQLLDRYRAIVANQQTWSERIAVQAEQSTVPDAVMDQLGSLGYVSPPPEEGADSSTSQPATRPRPPGSTATP